MRTFFTSDHHFGHHNIISYVNRPFASVAEMDGELIRRWNEVVSPGDVVYHLGDFSLHRSRQQLEPLVRQLNGNIRLLRGNHDRFAAAEKNLFEVVFREKHVEMLEAEGRVLAMSHHFHRQQSVDCDIHLFGHAHGKSIICQMRSNWIDVGVDVHDFKPLSLQEIIDLAA